MDPVHDGQADFAAFFRAEPGEELVQARFGAVLAPEPNGPAPFQIADHDAVLVSLGDGDLVDADHPGSGTPCPTQLFAHVLLVQLLDGIPIEVQFLGHFLEGGRAATSAHEEGEPLGVERIVGQPVQLFVLHAATPRALDPAQKKVEIDTFVPAGEIAHASSPLVVVAAIHRPADAAGRFFRRRWRVMTTAKGLPKTPRTLGRGTKPGKRYRSWRSLNFAIAKA